MVTYNKSEFQLKVENCKDYLHIMTFRSKNYAISKTYRFEILISTERPLQPQSLLNQPARLALQEREFIWGYLHSISYESFDTMGFYYKLAIVSPLFNLHKQSQSRIFLNSSPIEILQTLLQTHGFQQAQILFFIRQPFKKMEMITQHLETDLQFFQRLIAMSGLSYQIQSKAQSYRLILTDQLDHLTVHSTKHFDFQLQSGMISHESVNFLQKKQLLLKKVSIEKDQHEQQPNSSLKRTCTGRQYVPSFGEAHYYGIGEYRFDQILSKVKVYQTCIDVKRQVLKISTERADLTLGDLIEFNNPIEYFWTKLFRITSIDYLGDAQSGMNQRISGIRFAAKLTLIPFNVPYALEPLLKKPAGLHLGIVSGAREDQADLDEYGRYTINYHFPGAKNQSKRLYLAQAFTGQSLGEHFPLHTGTEVVVTYRNGDIDRPIILGALSTQVSKKYNCQMKTFAGHQVSFQGYQEKQSIFLRTADKNQKLCFRHHDKSPKISLINRGDHIFIQAAQGLTWQTKSNHYQKIAFKHQATIKQHYQLQTRQGDIILNAGCQLKIRTGKSFLIEANKHFQLRSQHDLRLVADNNLKLTTTGKMSLQCGNLHLKSGERLSVQSDHITLTTGKSCLKINGNIATFMGTSIQVIGGL